MIKDRDIAAINNALESMAPYTEVSIVYQVYQDTTPGNKPAGQAPTDNYTPDATVTSAMYRELTLEEVQLSGGVYERGDVEFSVRRSTKPSYKDRVDYDGARWKPKEIGRPPLNGVNLWGIVARKE